MAVVQTKSMRQHQVKINSYHAMVSQKNIEGDSQLSYCTSECELTESSSDEMPIKSTPSTGSHESFEFRNFACENENENQSMFDWLNYRQIIFKILLHFFLSFFSKKRCMH